MIDHEHALDLVRRAAAELVPELTQRLARHGLGEIEVARGEMRLRVTAAPPAGDPAPPGPTASDAAGYDTPDAARQPEPPSAQPAAAVPQVGVSAPAVGFFVYADGLGPGLAVAKGDAIGHVEMLGIRHDVRAPRTGTVSHLVAESGEAVEYGQVVVELQPAEDGR